MPFALTARLVLAFAVVMGVASAQTTTATPSAAELTRLYVQQAEDGQDEKQNYTFLIHAHNLTYRNGRVTNDSTSDSEQVFIGGLPYIRRLAKDGKPLVGKDLKHENELYEKAVKERGGLTEEDRMKATNMKKTGITFLPRDHFVSDFHQEILGHALVDGHDCILLDLTPLSKSEPDQLQLHIRLSIESTTFKLVEYRVETLGQIGNFVKGSVFEERDFYMDKVWLPVSSKIDALVGEGDTSRTVHFVDTDEFTHYRRFRTSATIHDAPPEAMTPQ